MLLKRWLRRLRRLTSHLPQTLPTRDAYRLWAASYPPAPHNRLMEVEQEAMLRLMPPLKGKLVLDLASGTGRYGLIAWNRRARSVLALDNSPHMLERNPLPRRVLSSADHLPLPNRSVDVVICALALGHLPDLSDAFFEMARVTRPGGVMLVSDVHPFMFLSGGQRTFTTESGSYAVEHYPHLLADYHAASRRAGLMLDAVNEPKLEERGNLPVVVVYRFIRPRSAIWPRAIIP